MANITATAKQISCSVWEVSMLWWDTLSCMELQTGYCVWRGSSRLCWWDWDDLEERDTDVNVYWFLGVINQLVSAWLGLQHALTILRDKAWFSSNLCQFYISKSADSSGISPEFLWYKIRTKNSLCCWNLGFHTPSICITKTTLFRHELFHI